MAKTDNPTTEMIVAPPPTETALVTLDYGADAAAGYEHQTKDDTTIPFLVLLQSNSPSVASGDRGARAGCWRNTVTEEVWDRETGVLFVPATTRHVYTEWVPRDEGGGFRGQHEVDAPTVLAALSQAATRLGKIPTGEGTELVETFYVYGVICGDGGHAESMAVLSFTSMKIRAYKTWMTRLRQFVLHTPTGLVRPPLYAHHARLGSAAGKNDKGSFYIPSISSADPRGLRESLLAPSDERFVMAKACREMVDAGAAKIDVAQAAASTDDGIPF